MGEEPRCRFEFRITPVCVQCRVFWYTGTKFTVNSLPQVLGIHSYTACVEDALCFVSRHCLRRKPQGAGP